jgi:hypothetical protein
MRSLNLRTVRTLTLVSATIALAAGCEAVKSANPLSPSVAGPIPGVSITEPKLLEPGSGWQLDNSTQQPVRLLIENASTSGVRPLTYTFELAADAGFTTIVFSRGGVDPGEGSRTSVQVSDRLPTGRNFFWRARAEDGANTGPYAGPYSFMVLTPVVIGVPAQLEPGNNATISSATPSFRMRRPTVSGPAGQIVFQVEVSANSAFAPGLALYQVASQGSDTKFNAPLSLDYSRTYYWRVRAFDAGPSGVQGAWSGGRPFMTPAPPVIVVPSPGPTGASCASQSTQQGVVACRRNQYGHMSSSQIVSFLKGVAQDLNAHPFSGGPYGILRKTSGNNCGGYSCDIICSGTTGWDVLADSEGAQVPTWNGPKAVPNACVPQ